MWAHNACCILSLFRCGINRSRATCSRSPTGTTPTVPGSRATPTSTPPAPTAGRTPGPSPPCTPGRGYDFIFITDHNRPAEVEAIPGLPLLALNGVEIDGKDETGAWFHAVGLGHDGELLSGEPIGVQTAFLRQRGALVVLAHPYWSGNTAEDALRHEFDGVEVYNHICNYLNGKSCGAYHWDRMLKRNPRTLGFAADDAHLNGNEPWDGGHIVLSAPSLTKENVLASLNAGNFYASLGPRFESIHVRPTHIYVRTSPVSAIRLVDDTPWAGASWPPTASPSRKPTSTSRKSTPTCASRSRTPTAVAPGPTSCWRSRLSPLRSTARRALQSSMMAKLATFGFSSFL